jgi:hypothetical protein
VVLAHAAAHTRYRLIARVLPRCCASAGVLSAQSVRVEGASKALPAAGGGAGSGGYVQGSRGQASKLTALHRSSPESKKMVASMEFLPGVSDAAHDAGGGEVP